MKKICDLPNKLQIPVQQWRSLPKYIYSMQNGEASHSTTPIGMTRKSSNKLWLATIDFDLPEKEKIATSF